MSSEQPSGSDIIKPTRFLGMRLDKQQLIKAFFGSSAAVTIAVLVLIIFSLLREGSGFLPTYRWELSVYRQAGLEYADFIQKPLSSHEELLSRLNRALNAELNTVSQTARNRRDAVLLAQSHIEDKTVLYRERLELALEQQEAANEAAAAQVTPAPADGAVPAATPAPVVDPALTAKITELRKELVDAATVAAEAEPLPKIYTEAEKKTLRAELAAMQPDAEDLPPFIQQLNAEAAAKMVEARKKFESFSDAIDQFEVAAEPVVEVHNSIKELALVTKEAAVQQHMAEDAKTKLLEAAAKAKTPEEKATFEADAAKTETTPIDYAAGIQPILAKGPEYEKLTPEFIAQVKLAVAALPAKSETKQANELVKSVRDNAPELVKQIESSVTHMQDWKWDKPVPLMQSLTAFLFGGDWITNSSWQDFYGVLPLLTGSLLISITALVIALPISVAAAIYVNQFATLREQELIKPVIEFIQAIPSVVLGFIGISVVGDLIKESSNVAWLQWIPGFPIQERLNMFNAGCLLALMAIPTMFSLAEDAINNVPRAFSEASEALGSTKLQTVFRVIVPASVSGILAAMLLGLGRILGETMVVLLVAGNRIAIPNFSDGLGTIFQPAHTLTGIIAQELGEVSRGSAHWQALFMVGILLFLFSLLINWSARVVVRKFQLPKI